MKLNYLSWAHFLTPGFKQLAADHSLDYIPPSLECWSRIKRLAEANRYTEILQGYLQALVIYSCDYDGFPMGDSVIDF